MAKSKTSRGNSLRRGSRHFQRVRAGMDFDYANDQRGAQSSIESSTTPRADASTRGVGGNYHGSDHSDDTHRRSSYIPPQERERQSLNPFPATSPHLCRCDQRYKAIIREICREQKVERHLAGLSRSTPNEDEMDWDLGSG